MATTTAHQDNPATCGARTAPPVLLLTLWIVAILAGFTVLTRYAYTPTPSQPPRRTWPRDSGLTHSPELPTLVMAAHPRCPCTRASIDELAVVTRYGRDRFRAYILFYYPGGESPDWCKSDLWETASRIPELTVVPDHAGIECARFGLSVSGGLALYNPNGELLFSGGITSARGHEGGNDGREAVISLITSGKSPLREFPVFGCRIFDDPAGPQPWTNYRRMEKTREIMP